MNLNELRDRAYKTACEHGFHDEELSNEHCLCLVISELMEAVEADRKGRFAKVPVDKKGTIFDERTFHYQNKYFAENFETYIKDCVEDELADAVIRLLDLAGLRNISIDDFLEEAIYGASESCVGETFTESIYAISTLPIRHFYKYNYSFENQIGHMLLSIFGLAKHLNIDLLWHVNQKMRYNELRENKHGKRK
jgi:NTP pyrophosphatase (non-canonical NTP hydrolase)